MDTPVFGVPQTPLTEEWFDVFLEEHALWQWRDWLLPIFSFFLAGKDGQRMSSHVCSIILTAQNHDNVREGIYRLTLLKKELENIPPDDRFVHLNSRTNQSTFLIGITGIRQILVSSSRVQSQPTS